MRTRRLFPEDCKEVKPLRKMNSPKKQTFIVEGRRTVVQRVVREMFQYFVYTSVSVYSLSPIRRVCALNSAVRFLSALLQYEKANVSERRKELDGLRQKQLEWSSSERERGKHVLATHLQQRKRDLLVGGRFEVHY